MAVRRNTTIERAAASIAIGAFVGGVLTFVAFVMQTLVRMALSPAREGVSSFFLQLPISLLIVGGAAAFSFLLGMIFIAAPIWFFLHRFGLRGMVPAVLLGVLLTSAMHFALSTFQYGWGPPPSDGSSASFGGAEGMDVENNRMTPLGWRHAIEQALWMAIPGGGAALTVWFIAYRRNSPAVGETTE